MFTPRDELERVRTFDRQLAEAHDEQRNAAAAIRCDSCGDVVDQDSEPGRYRHAGCPTPALPPAALAVLKRLRTRQTDHDHVDA